jgi:hypothetical protein
LYVQTEVWIANIRRQHEVDRMGKRKGGTRGRPTSKQTKAT